MTISVKQIVDPACCPSCGQTFIGLTHMCPVTVDEMDDRTRSRRTADWLLSWARAEFQLQLGRVRLSLQVRQFMPLTLNLHLLAVMLSWGSRQFGVVVERRDGKRYSRWVRLHAGGYYHEFPL